MIGYVYVLENCWDLGGYNTQMRTMVLEYAHLHLPLKSPSFVGQYSSTMEHMGIYFFYMIDRTSEPGLQSNVNIAWGAYMEVQYTERCGRTMNVDQLVYRVGMTSDYPVNGTATRYNYVFFAL